MAEQTRVSGDLVVIGEILGATGIDYPSGSIVNADISGSAAIAASKSQRSISVHIFQSGVCADETIIARIIKGATGILKHFTCACVISSNGDSSVTLDLKKNGVSVLAGMVTLNAGTGTTEVVAVITTTAVVDGDILTVVINGEWSGSDALASGVFAQIDLDESYAA